MLKYMCSTREARVLATLLVVALAAGCGDKDDGDVTGIPNATSFSATLTGGGAGTYTGATSSVVQGPNFAIGLVAPDGKFSLVFTRSGGRPAVGNYPIVGNPVNGFTGVMTVNNNGFIYTTTSGTLNITSSSSSELKGTFTFQAQASGSGGSATSGTGSFTSTCIGC